MELMAYKRWKGVMISDNKYLQGEVAKLSGMEIPLKILGACLFLFFCYFF